uniref:Uncharacterized protein n=1 Tax=Opuntia streptacantha TaxID=393608 RepID=A0A7C9CGP6_OPUST
MNPLSLSLFVLLFHSFSFCLSLSLSLSVCFFILEIKERNRELGRSSFQSSANQATSGEGGQGGPERGCFLLLHFLSLSSALHTLLHFRFFFFFFFFPPELFISHLQTRPDPR